MSALFSSYFAAVHPCHDFAAPRPTSPSLTAARHHVPPCFRGCHSISSAANSSSCVRMNRRKFRKRYVAPSGATKAHSRANILVTNGPCSSLSSLAGTPTVSDDKKDTVVGGAVKSVAAGLAAGALLKTPALLAGGARLHRAAVKSGTPLQKIDRVGYVAAGVARKNFPTQYKAAVRSPANRSFLESALKPESRDKVRANVPLVYRTIREAKRRKDFAAKEDRRFIPGMITAGLAGAVGGTLLGRRLAATSRGASKAVRTKNTIAVVGGKKWRQSSRENGIPS